jgi:copper transport protein
MTTSKFVRRVALLALFLSPAPAWAHARLLRSEPAAGSRIGSIQFIRLWFSERPEIALSSATLKNQSGQSFSLAAAVGNPNDPMQVSFAVTDSLPAGVYTLTWRTVASDGHPSHGAFGFVVLAAAAAVPPPPRAAIPADTASGTASASTAGGPLQSDAAASPANSLARALSFAGIFLVIGVTVFNILVVARAGRIGGVELAGKMESRAAVVGVGAGAVVIASAFARILLESRMMSNMPDMQSMTMSDMAMHTRWGFAIELEIVAAFLALISFAVGVKRVRGAWLMASVFAMILAFTPAMAGHAAASPRFTGLMIATDFLHVLGGAGWLGTLFCVMTIGVPIAMTLDVAERWQSIASLVNAFSPIALMSAGLVVASGAIASWLHLETISALWTTTYGRVLLIKLVLVVLTLTLGAYNFRTVQPQLVKEEGAARLRKSAVLELGFGALILVVTGFLTGIAP